MPRGFLSYAPKLGATAVLCFALCACAAGPRSAPRAPARAVRAQPLPEPAALSLLDRLLLEQRQLPARGWRVRLAGRADFEVDLRLGESRFGIEWVSAGDRALTGAALPEPDPGGQLRVVRALEASEPALILVLDERSYRVTHDFGESQREIERRLRRDVQDFIAYAVGQ